MPFWNKKIINLEEKYFGLDLGDSSIKVFQLEKKGDIDQIRSFGFSEISPGCIENGRIIDPEKLEKIISKTISSAGPKKINTKNVICSIPESKVFLRTVSIPLIKEEEAAEAVKWEIESGIPLEIDKMYFDWQFLGITDGKQEVLTVAVSREVVDDIVSVLEACGLSVRGLEMESICACRSLVPEKAKEKTYLIVDIGTLKTSFIIVQGGVPCFTSSIPFSSNGIDDLISSQTGASREESEKIKVTQGIEHLFQGKDNPVFNLVRPLLENLSTEIERTIDFYRTTFPSAHPEIEKIIISGGTSNLKGLVPYLATNLSYEVVLGDPWVNLNLGKNLPIISRTDSVRYAIAIGLAMREINYGNKT